MIRNTLCSALAAVATIISTTGTIHAHSGDHTFFEAFDNYRQARAATRTAKDYTTTATVMALSRETANLFGAVRNADGETVLPPGTVCDHVAINTDGHLTASFTLPPYYDAETLTELKNETAIGLIRSLTANVEVSGVRIEARENIDSDYYEISEFLPPPVPADNSFENWYEPNGPGPSKAVADQPVNESAPGTNSGGQGPISVGAGQNGALSGRVVYFTAGHGWTWSGTGWGLQRPTDLEGMNEDWGNADQIEFFAQYLFNAGATVVPMRPIGHQPNAVIVDNPTATFTGAWSESQSARYYGSGTPYHWATKSTVESATATFTPNIPEAGFYPVYVWALYGSDRLDNQLYKINHSGGTNEVRINHRRVGAGWIWAGTYYFNAGSDPTAGSVVVSNQSTTDNGSVIIADAVRFGNGTGPSGKLRENEAARYWIRDGHGNGGDPSVYSYSAPGWPTANSGDSGNTINSPPLNAAHMNRDDGQGFYQQVFLGWHSNAASVVTARGSEALFNDVHTPLRAQAFAILLSDTLDNDAMIEDSNWEHTWWNRKATAQGNYGEINGRYLGDREEASTAEMTASIIEVAFHNNVQDAALLRDPKVRNVVARSQYRGILKYFNQYSPAPKPPVTFLPEPPVNFRAINNGTGGATIAWAAPPTGGANGHAATGYKIYQSTNGYGYGLAGTTSGVGSTSLNITGLTPGQTYYFRVAATNVGGESMPSESLAVRVTASGAANTLVVNGYDRLDRFNNVLEPGYTSTERIRLRRNNSYDYLIEHGTALHAIDRDFDSASNEAVALGNVSLANYTNVIWLLGEEDAKTQTLNLSERGRVSAFLGAGGRLFITGSEIGAHLSNASTGDPTFLGEVLKAGFAADDAGGYVATGTPGTALAGITMNFAPDADMYDVDKPDRLLAVNGSVVAATYTGAGGSGAAAVQFDGGYRLVYFGFPFEAINNATTRQQVMAAVLGFFDSASSSVDDWAIF